MFAKCAAALGCDNPFFPYATFLYPRKHQKTVRERERVEKGCIGKEWVK